MMKNIIDLIKEKIRNHKKLSIIALLLFLLIGGTVGYVLLTNNETNNNPKVTQTNNQNKNPDTNVTGSNNAKKKEDKKSDDKKKDDKKSDEKKTDVNPEATATPSNDATVEETNNTASNNVSNNTSSNKNTVSNNGCKTVYHEAVTQQVWVVDTSAHDETTYTLVYYVQFSNGEKWYQDGSADFANRVADYTASNGLSYSIRAENQPNTVHYDEVGHYETQVVSPARTETVIDTPAYTTCE